MRIVGRLTTWVPALAIVLALGISSAAHADWGYGSGGSWGSRGGSSGGSWGRHSLGSRGVGPVRRLVARVRSFHASHGSRGSWGSHGGSSGGYVVRSWGSSGGSHGSSGGSYGTYTTSSYAPVYYQSAPVYYDTAPVGATSAPVGESTPVEAQKPPVQGEAPAENAGDATLSVDLPSDAVVYVNGHKTRTTGANRRYVSRNLRYDRLYPYEVKAVVIRNGQELVQTKVIDLAAGQDRSVSFDFAAERALLTSLSISVPADAQVTLGGVTTEASGPFRFFSTKALSAGETWNDYEIVVTVVRDGRTQTERQTIDLVAGQSAEVAFEMNGPTLVASK